MRVSSRSSSLAARCRRFQRASRSSCRRWAVDEMCWCSMFSINRCNSVCFESTYVPWYAPGRNPACQFSESLIGRPPCCPPRHSAVFCASSRHLKSAPADTVGTRNVRMRWFRVLGRRFQSFPLVQTWVLCSPADFLGTMAFCFGCIGPVILYGPFGWDKSPISQRRTREWRELAQESPECRGGPHGNSSKVTVHTPCKRKIADAANAGFPLFPTSSGPNLLLS